MPRDDGCDPALPANVCFLHLQYSVFSGESVPDMPTLSQDFFIGPASNIGAPFKSRQNWSGPATEFPVYKFTCGDWIHPPSTPATVPKPKVAERFARDPTSLSARRRCPADPATCALVHRPGTVRAIPQPRPCTVRAISPPRHCARHSAGPAASAVPGTVRVSPPAPGLYSIRFLAWHCARHSAASSVHRPCNLFALSKLSSLYWTKDYFCLSGRTSANPGIRW
jgi:hypothetical protein